MELSSDMVTRHENIPVIWSDYLTVLGEAKKNLEMNKEKFKNGLLDQAEVRIFKLKRGLFKCNVLFYLMCCAAKYHLPHPSPYKR